MSATLVSFLDSACPALAKKWQTRTGINDPEYFVNIKIFVIGIIGSIPLYLFMYLNNMNIVGFVSIVTLIAYCVNIEDTGVNYQSSQLSLIGKLLFLCLWLDIYAFGAIAIFGLLRAISCDYVIGFIFETLCPVVYLKNGIVLPKHLLEADAQCAFAHIAVNNRCGWESIFLDPDLARDKLNTRPDGRISADLLKRLVLEGLIAVVIDGKLYRSDHKPASIKVSVRGYHMEQIYVLPDETTDEWDVFDSFGVVLPKARPLPVARLAIREEMVKQCNELNEIRQEDGINGRIAECGHLAAREELDILDEIASKPLMDNLTPAQISNLYLTNAGWYVYNTVSKRWVGRPKSKEGVQATENIGPNKRPDDPNIMEISIEVGKPWEFDSYPLAWSGQDFVCVEWQGKHAQTVWTPEGKVVKPNYLLIIDKLKYRRGACYLKTAKSLIGKKHTCDVILEEGVPSCGKTHNIVTRSSPRDLITLPGREGAKEYLMLGKSAVTIDSIIVNGWSGRSPQVLWIDEGLLTHCGAIEMAIQLLTPEITRVFGDRRQLPFYPRVANYRMKHKEYPWTGDPIYHNKAWKNPKVVCDMLRPLYPNGYVWANDIEGFMDVIHTTNANGVKASHDVYLTYRQDEKAKLKKLLPAGSNIMTIHESQGLRFRDVALIRLKINDLDIYKSTPHHIVAVSRSSNSFVYYTCKPDDILSKWVGKRGKPGIYQKHEKPFKGCKYKISGGKHTKSTKIVVKLIDHEPSEGYDEWMSLLRHIVPISEPISLPFLFEKVHRRFIKWNKDRVVMPTASAIQAQYDGMFRRRNLDIAKGDRLIWPIKWFPGVRINYGKIAKKPQLEQRPAIHPKLITTQAPRAMRHSLDVREAMEKRVVAPPQQQLGYTPDLKDKLVEAFMKNVDQEAMKALNLRIRYDTRELRRFWWNTRNGRRKSSILASNPCKINGSKYFCAPRPDHKVRTDNSHPDTVEPGQLVSAHPIFWTSVFAPYFQVLLIKILGCMKDYIVLHTRLTWEELSDIIDNKLSGKTFQALELDISKFDKSQLRSVLEAQCEIMRLFQIPDDLVNTWHSFHEMCILEAASDGVSFKVAFQRRSGDSLTWLGNTMVLIMIMGHLYDLEKTCMTLLSGDDNLACFDVNYKLTDQSRKAAEELNFEIKTFCFENSMYFSSRFIICTRHGWVAVADPIKVISRLGRSDIQGRDHLKEIHNSFKALHYMYSDQEVRLLLDEAVTARYNSILTTSYKSMMIYIEIIAAIVDNYNNLENLFYGTEEEWNLTLDPNERVGEGNYRNTEPVFEEIHFQ